MKSCFGFPLQTGGILIGIIDFIWGILVIVLGTAFYSGFVGVSSTSESASEAGSENQKYWAIGTLSVAVPQIVFGPILVYGILRECLPFMKSWVFYKSVTIHVSSIAFIVMIFIGGCQWWIIVLQILATALNIYFFKAISDLRKQISTS